VRALPRRPRISVASHQLANACGHCRVAHESEQRRALAYVSQRRPVAHVSGQRSTFSPRVPETSRRPHVQTAPHSSPPRSGSAASSASPGSVALSRPRIPEASRRPRVRVAPYHLAHASGQS
jgi:hypothetical protein